MEGKKIGKKEIIIITLLVVVAVLAVVGVRVLGPGKNGSGSKGEKISVAVAENSKPNSYTDLEGKLTGYEVEILEAIDESLPQYTFAIEAVSQSAEEIGIDTGKYALIAQGFFKTEERAAKYLIPSENTGVSLMKIFTLEDNTDISSMADLQGKKLAPVPPNGGIFNFITGYNEKNSDAQITFETAENVPIANRFSELADGKYDAIIWPSANLDLGEIEKSLGKKFRATDPVNINETFFLISKNNEDLYRNVDAAISALKKSGKLSEISINYFGEDIFLYK